MKPLDGARAALAVVDLLWLARKSSAAHGVLVRHGDAKRLRAAGVALRAAVEAMERGEPEAAQRVSDAVDLSWVEARSSDSIQGLLTEAKRLARGEKWEIKRGR